jgi:hypothetical protein
MEPNPAPKKKGLPCPRCGNRLRVRADQIGSQVICPKCDATFTVARPGSQQPSVSSSDLDAYEPEIPLVRSSIVPDEQMTDLSPSANRQTGYEVDWSTSDELEAEAPHERSSAVEIDYLTLAKERGLVRSRRVSEPPKWTFFTGVFTFPWHGENLTRWVAISFGLTVTGEIFVAAVENSHGGLGTLLMPVLSMLAAVMFLLTFSFIAPCFLASVQDTADGFDEVQESTMPEWDQWFFSFLSVLSVWVLSGALGCPLTLIEPIGPVAIPLSSLVLFPVLLLSAMECESFLLPFSRPVLASLVRAWPAWIVFYLVSTVVLAGWFVVTRLTIGLAPYLTVLVLAPAFGAVVLIYARLLGRLGWRISGSRTAVQDDRSPVRSHAGESARKTRKRARLRMPDDLDEAAHMIAPDRLPSPPINSEGRP